MATPKDKETWGTMFKSGWPIKSIAERTNFSPETISKHLRRIGAKREKAAPRVGEATGIGAEFTAFRVKERFKKMREGLRAWIENEILSLDFNEANDSRDNLEWIYNRINKAQTEDELYALSALAMQNTP